MFLKDLGVRGPWKKIAATPTPASQQKLWIIVRYGAVKVVTQVDKIA